MVECSGEGKMCSGGLCMMWRHGIEVSLKSYSKNDIMTEIQPDNGTEPWPLAGSMVGWNKL